MRNIWLQDVSHMVRLFNEHDESGSTWCGMSFSTWARIPPMHGSHVGGFCDEVVSCLWCAGATRP